MHPRVSMYASIVARMVTVYTHVRGDVCVDYEVSPLSPPRPPSPLLVPPLSPPRPHPLPSSSPPSPLLVPTLSPPRPHPLPSSSPPSPLLVPTLSPPRLPPPGTPVTHPSQEDKAVLTLGADGNSGEDGRACGGDGAQVGGEANKVLISPLTPTGLELMEILERMGERVAAMGLKCGERRLHQLANVFGEMRHPETVFSHFRLDAQEQETLFCFMQEEVEKLGEVRSSMERLNTLRSLLRKKKPAPATSLLSELQAASADALTDGEGKEEAEKEGDSSSWMPRCDLPGAEEILKLTATIAELQSRCLWSVELDHVVRLLVLAIILLRDRIISVFAINARSSDALTREGSLGRAGLALRYAKVINLAEKLMKYPFMAAGSTRDELYGLLTYSTKKDLALRLSRPVTSSKSKDAKTEETGDSQTRKGTDKKGEKGKDGDEDGDDEDEDDDDDDGFTWLKKPSPLNDPRGLGGKGGPGKEGEEDDEDMEEWERRMRKALSLLPTLAQHTIAWNDAITVKPSSNRKATRLLRVQTLYHAQKAVIDASLLDALEGVSRLVASDASNLTQLNSRKMEAMAAEARKKLDKASADSKKPRAVMISGIFKPKRAAAGIVQGAPLPMVFEPATEVGKVTEKGKAPELSPRAAVPLSPTGASAAEPVASFLISSLVEATPALSPPPSATPPTPPPPDTLGSPKGPLKPRPPSQPPVRPPFRGSAANSADLSGGGDNPRSPRGYADGPPKSPRAYVRFADTPPAGLGDSSHANRPVSPLGQSEHSTPSITIIPPSHGRVSSTFRAPVPPALLSPTCVAYDATPKSPAPVASLQRLNARKETRDEPFVTTEGLLAQAQAEALKAQAQAQAEAEAEAAKAQALKEQARQAQAEVVKAHALKVKALRAQAQAEEEVQAQSVAVLQAQVSFSLDRSIGSESQSASSESPKTRPSTAPASAAAAAAAAAAVLRTSLSPPLPPPHYPFPNPPPRLALAPLLLPPPPLAPPPLLPAPPPPPPAPPPLP
ncbi:unnamed protein product [Closterium sp. Yama58-4]|nr:unnamed protein product [Closterium sp. Yama58-4]